MIRSDKINPKGYRPSNNVSQKRGSRSKQHELAQSRGPDDGPDHIFLIRAIELAGRARFEDRWVSDRQTKPKPQAIPLWADIKVGDIEISILADVANTLRAAVPEVVPADDFQAFDDEWVLKPELWMQAVKARGAEIATITAADEHREAIYTDLLAKLRRGELPSFYRAVAGGEYRAAPPSIWNFEGWKSRFSDGLIDPDAPYASLDDSWGEKLDRRLHYMFVGRDEFERAMHIEADSPDLYRLWPELNPHLKSALLVAERIRRAGSQPLNHEVEASLQDLADRYGLPLTAGKAKQLAAIVRSSESWKGGRPKKSSSS